VAVALAVGLAGEYPQLWIHQRIGSAKPRRRDRHQLIQALGDAGDERCIPPPRLLECVTGERHATDATKHPQALAVAVALQYEDLGHVITYRRQLSKRARR